jgi:DNA-binding NarL/FixJ family response regulator
MQAIDTSQVNDQDRLAQNLSALIVQVNALQTLVAGVADETTGDAINRTPTNLDSLRNGLTILEQMTRAILDDVRSASQDTPPSELDGVTLAEALSRAVEETAESLGLSSRLVFTGDVDGQGGPKEHTLSKETEYLLYQVAREALYQVQQHIGARKLRLTLNYGREEVQMSIEDDGLPGSPAPTVENAPVPLMVQTSSTTDAVLSNLRQRIELLGGSLDVSSQPEQGTRVQARVPYMPHVHQVELPAPVTVGTAPNAQFTAPNAAPDIVPSTPNPGKQFVAPNIASITVLVVDGQAVTRAGLRRLLESYPDLQVVGEAADGVQAVSETLELGPKVVLIDMQLPNGQSLEVLRQIKQLNLETRVLLLSALDREDFIYETLRAGADGYVLKDIAPDELAQAVRAVARGEVLVQPQLAGRLLSRFGKQTRGNYAPYQEALTEREQEVLRLLARGLRNKEIAARLYVSERTVNFHLANIYQKLNVSGRTEALSKALEQGLITV